MKEEAEAEEKNINRITKRTRVKRIAAKRWRGKLDGAENGTEGNEKKFEQRNE